MVQLNFNAAGVKPNAALEAIPTGQYPVIIVRSEEKPTRAGTGAYIEFEMQVQGGEYAGRKLFDRLNIKNSNQTAVDIAYATLSAICHVTGRMSISQTEQLHGIPFIAVVQKKVRDDLPPPAPGEEPQYSNEVKGYKDIHGNDPNSAGRGPTTGGNPEWAGQQQAAQAPVQQQAAPVQEQPAQQQATPSWANGAAPVQEQQAPAVQQAPAQNPPSWAST